MSYPWKWSRTGDYCYEGYRQDFNVSECDLTKSIGLEIEVNSDIIPDIGAIREIAHRTGYISNIHQDGSCRGSGNLELVSIPLTRYQILDYLYEIEDIIKFQRTSEKENPLFRGAGIHLHISNTMFSGLGHRKRLLAFAQHHPHLIRKIGERGSSNYNENISPSADIGYSGRKTVRPCTGKDTFELRFFQSTSSIDKIEQYIDFAFELFDYTKDASESDVINLVGFKESISEKLYTHLKTSRYGGKKFDL